MKSVVYQVDQSRVSLDIEGETSFGGDYCLLLQDDDLTKNLDWHDAGYTIEKFLSSEDFEIFREKIRKKILGLVEEMTGAILSDVQKYHQVVNEEQHEEILSRTYNEFRFSQLDIDKGQLEKRIEEILGFSVTTKNPWGKLDPDVFHLRVVRPDSGDNNPFHRDVWLDRLRNAINIYVPLWGSDINSSLPLVPGSHKWKECEIERTSEGAKINGKIFSVPAVVGAKREMSAIRPNPNLGDFMLFSPYLIHGGGKNMNSDTTRFSLELRFWRTSN